MRQLPWIALVALTLAAWPVIGQPGSAVDYRVEIDRGSVFSTLREKDGRNSRLVSFQMRIRRLSDNAIATDVTPDEILVEEDGQKVAKLEILAPRSEKLTLILALDISGSMARAGKLEEARRAALTFLDRLDPRAGVGLILFDHLIRVAEPPSTDPAQLPQQRDRLRQLIREAKPQGGTAYRDATARAAQMLREAQGRRVIVVMTDGVDMNSKATQEDAVRAALHAELPVYTVGIGDPGKNEPVNTVLVLDHSGSMGEKASASDSVSKLDALKVAARRFVELMRPTAKTTVLPFSSTIQNPGPFSNDRAVHIKRIEGLQLAGGTLLFDATYAGIETLVASELPGRRAVVVLTDGKDDGNSRRRGVNDVIRRAQQAHTPLYMLGLGQADQIDEPVMRRMASETRGAYFHAGSQQKLLEVFEDLSIQLHDDGIDEESLRELATRTGGRYTHVSQVSQLQIFYERLADELESTYKVSFESRRPTHDGTARGIDVRITRGGQVVSTVDSVDDIARGVVVPQMNYRVYLLYLVVLGLLLAVPVGVRRIYRAFGGV
ncbi:MAG: VWA domain-containing protein [Gemmataceae bacterium]